MNFILSLRFLSLIFLFTATIHKNMAQSVSWHLIESKGNAEERHENGLVDAGDKFILLGGRGMKPVDIYDTQEKTWTRGAQPPIEIHHMQAVSLNGLVYVVGAFTGPYPYETPLTNILIYDPLLDIWAIGPEIPAERRRGAAGVVVYNNKIYVVNGIINGHTSGWVHWLDEFDPATNQWQKLPDAPRARDHVHAAVIGNKLYVAGGRRSGYSSETFTTTVKETNVFDFTTQEWTELPSPEGDIPTVRAGSAAAVYQGNLLIIGGESGEQESAHNEVEMLDIASGIWKSLAPLKRGRHGTQAIYFDDMVFIGAGSGNRGGGPELNSFEVLAPKENPTIKSNPLKAGKISASVENLVFNNPGNGDKKQITIENKGGNQAIFISYILLDNTAAFEITFDNETPLVLAPGQRLPIDIVFKGGSGNGQKALLLIKSVGKSAPVSIPISVER